MSTKFDPHSFTKRILSWKYCAKCGLVALRNDVTDEAARLGCNWEEIKRGRK